MRVGKSGKRRGELRKEEKECKRKSSSETKPRKYIPQNPRLKSIKPEAEQS
jgi:hypothetical protein